MHFPPQFNFSVDCFLVFLASMLDFNCYILTLSLPNLTVNSPNSVCRIVSGARKFDHVTPIRKELNWLSVQSQLYYRNATMAFRCMTGQAPDYLSSKFIKRAEVSRRSTRNSQLLQIPFFRTASGQRTFFYRTVNLWNSLDNSFKLCNSVKVFKKRLRTKLLKEL